METTTIYTKVANISRRNVTSPLDRLVSTADNKANAPATKPDRSVVDQCTEPVGRMSISLHPGDQPNTAGVCITLKVGDIHATLHGAVVRESRPGWFALDLPPADHWNSTLQQLPPAARARALSPAFYENLRNEVSRRFIQLRQQT